MATEEQRYDEKTKTMWIYKDLGPDELVPNEELRDWVEQKKIGETADGRPIDAVNYVFADPKCAEYNAQPLSFASMGVYTGNLDSPEKYDSAEGSPEFDTKEDFGIE